MSTGASSEAQSDLDVLQDYQGQESCQEVTELYRAANKLIKTLYIARTSLIAGNDNVALLNYNEVASLFNDFSQSKPSSFKKTSAYQSMDKNLAICYNNIGCIHLRQKNFRTQYQYFSRAIGISEQQIKSLVEGTTSLKSPLTAPLETIFKYACRLFNMGYALYLNYLSLLKGNTDDQYCKRK